MIVEALLIGLGVFKLVDLLKEATVVYGPWPSVAKSGLTLLLASLISLIRYQFDFSTSAVIVGLAASGFAPLFHEMHSWLNINVNSTMTEMILRGRSRRT